MEVLRAQAAERYPAFAEADLIIETGESAHHLAVDAIIRALAALPAVAAP